jgi:predicted dienelactone hydrolase
MPVPKLWDFGQGAQVGTAGYRCFRWNDSGRLRPVWTDVWYPVRAPEQAVFYGAGQGSAAMDAAIDTSAAPHRLIVMSHGAFGSARDYGWIAEHLARRGFVVLGVSHYGESWVYGPETIEQAAVTRLWLRPPDCTFAIECLLSDHEFKESVDPARVGALGHSSGGATAMALGGATFDAAALMAYCRSGEAANDLGCRYAETISAAQTPPPQAAASYRDPRVVAIAVLDPAAGPGFNATSLAAVRVPVLVVGSEENDFLPYAQHAAHFAALLPRCSLITLRRGEGHFVYLNCADSGLQANGVPLYVDRLGVDRQAVHARLAPAITDFFETTLGGKR